MTIQLIGDISEEAFKEFDAALTEAEESGDKVVEVVLSSSGGSAYDALAFYDRIRVSPIDVHITLYGTAFSAAVLVLAAGDHKRMGSQAWVMVHEDTSFVSKHDRVTAALKSVKQSQKLETQWNELLERMTGTPANKWEYLHQNETFLDAGACLELGLIDEVIGAR